MKQDIPKGVSAELISDQHINPNNPFLNPEHYTSEFNKEKKTLTFKTKKLIL
ncbi:MAG: hypothetical protein KC646_03735 [Candidatus Cloacimonetes bacterium]|nr:hypothetical protein [Candidatus Cloacimonadota bacterium]